MVEETLVDKEEPHHLIQELLTLEVNIIILVMKLHLVLMEEVAVVLEMV